MDEKKYRIQFDLNEEAREQLDELQRMSGAATRAELIRNALRLYAWYMAQVHSGSEILVRKDEETVKLMPIG